MHTRAWSAVVRDLSHSCLLSHPPPWFQSFRWNSGPQALLVQEHMQMGVLIRSGGPFCPCLSLLNPLYKVGFSTATGPHSTGSNFDWATVMFEKQIIAMCLSFPVKSQTLTGVPKTASNLLS